MRAAAEFIEDLEDARRADEELAHFLRGSSLDPFKKREVSRAVLAWFRWHRWMSPQDGAGRQVAAALELHNRFSMHPAGFGSLARAVPEWSRSEAPFPSASLAQLQREPTLWIRASRETASQLGDCEHAPRGAAPAGARLDAWAYRGRDDLFQTPAFKNGELEIQDLASQLVGHVCAPQSGETWWDACAGEGGKTLHLASMMASRGVVWGTDRSARRLLRLRQRAARAQAFNVRMAPWNGEGLPDASLRERCDGVLLDAPCSGLGTWQRHPHARWTVTLDDVRELAVIQRRLLDTVALAVKPGGRLIYSVCTVTHAETTAVADAWEKAHRDWERAPLGWPGGEARRLLWPHDLDCNGMFFAAWRKKS